MSTNSGGLNTQQSPSDMSSFGTQGSSGNPWGTTGNTFGTGGAFGAAKDPAQASTGGPYPVASVSGDSAGFGGNALGDTMGGQQGGGMQMNPDGMGYSGGLTGQTRTPTGFSGSSFTQSTGSNPYTPSPYLDTQAGNIRTQFNQNLNENTLPGLRDKFVGAGGLGGSRQGIAEGLAAGRSNTGMANAITDLYANDYNNSQNRATQTNIAGMNASVAANGQYLNDQLGRLNSERGFYSTNRGQDLQQLGLGAGLLGQANQGFLGQGQGIYGLGQQEQNAPWQQLQNYSGLLQPYTQAGATNSGTGTQQYMYNPTMQWIGTAANAAGSLGKLFG